MVHGATQPVEALIKKKLTEWRCVHGEHEFQKLGRKLRRVADSLPGPGNLVQIIARLVRKALSKHDGGTEEFIDAFFRRESPEEMVRFLVVHLS